MCALSPRVHACDETDLQPREGTDPSLIPTVVDIIIGKVRVKVSRSPTSNPRLLEPARRPFSLLIAHCVVWRFSQVFGYSALLPLPLRVRPAVPTPWCHPGAARTIYRPHPPTRDPVACVRSLS